MGELLFLATFGFVVLAAVLTLGFPELYPGFLISAKETLEFFR